MELILITQVIALLLLILDWKTPKPHLRNILHIFIVLLIVISGIFTYKNIQKNDEEMASLNDQFQTANTQLKTVSTQLKTVDEQLNTVNDQNSELIKNTDNLVTQSSELQIQVVDLKTTLMTKDQRIIELEKLLPRKLNTIQQNLLYKYMKDSNVKLEVKANSTGDLEVINFAKQITSILLTAGCKVIYNFNMIIKNVGQNYLTGITILYNNNNDTDAYKLKTALSVIGLNPKLHLTKQELENGIVLSINPKPLS